MGLGASYRDELARLFGDRDVLARHFKVCRRNVLARLFGLALAVRFRRRCG